MKRQRSNAPKSPALVWRTPHTSRVLADSGQLPEACAHDAHGEERPGPLFAAESDPQPMPDVVDKLGLRAWFYCATCAEYRPTPKGYGGASYCGGTGYGYTSHDADAQALCYRCCGKRDEQSMRETGRAVLYLSRVSSDAERTTGSAERAPYLRASNWRVTNWPGSLTLPVLSLRRGSHNWRNVERVDVWFIFAGYVWHGVQLGDSQILRAKRTRTEWRDRGNGRGFGPYTPRKSRAKVASGIPAGTPMESDKLARGIMPERIDGRTHGPGR